MVAQDTGTFYLNQSENWVYHQVRRLTRFRSIFLAKRTANLEQFAWDPVYTLERLGPVRREWNRWVRNLTGYYPFFGEVCRREGVRLVHVHYGLNGIRALRLASSLGVPLVTSFYGRDMFFHRRGEEGLRRRYRALFAGGSAFIAEGPAARARLVRIGCPPEKVHVHRLGVDLEAIPFHPRSLAGDEPLKVLMAARFTEKKGMPYGVEAFCRVAREEPRLRLTVVGGAGDSPAEERIGARLRELVAEHGVADRVRFTGFLPRPALHELARDHHVFLHPSVHAASGDAEGGHPVVITEMAASGMPVIATRHCDIPEVVVDRETGWLCPERDVDALAAAMRDALRRPHAVTEYGAAGRKLVEARYDLARQTLDPLYETVLAGHAVQG